MPMRQTLTLLLMLICFSTSAPAKNKIIVVKDDFGGVLVDYIRKYNSWEREGIVVKVEGLCASACTLMLGIIRKNHICLGKDAQFGFHAARIARDGEPIQGTDGKVVLSDGGTQLMMDHYPAEVKEWIAKNGGLSYDLIYLKGKELKEIVKGCK